MARRSSSLALLLALAINLLQATSAQASTPRIGAEDDWYPYTAWRDGRVMGMSVDLVRAAFATSATDFELTPYPYSRCMELARTGKLAACFNTTPNAVIRASFLVPEEMLFSEDIVLWSRSATPPLEDLDELAGKRVAATIGYTYGERFDRLKIFERVPVRRDLNGFLMLQRGRVDYMVAFRAPTEALLLEHPELAGQFKAAITLYRPKLYLTFSRQHPQARELLKRFDQGMRQIRQDGTYDKILQHWQHVPEQSVLPPSTLQGSVHNNAESP